MNTSYNIAIPLNLIALAVKTRTLKNKYQTNDFIKCLGNFAILKSLTTTGKIHFNLNQKKELHKHLKCSRNQLNNILNNLQKFEFIKRSNSGAIMLKSWEKINELFNCDYSEKINIDYNSTDNKRIDLLIYATEIKINQAKQLNAFNCKLIYNPTIFQLIKVELKNYFGIDADTLSIEQLQKYILKLQCKLFEIGTNNSKAVCMFRAGIDRKLVTLKKVYNTKSVLSITYLKKLFVKFKIATIEKFSLQSCNGERAYKYNKNFANNFNKAAKQPVWFLTDAINLI